MKRTARSSMPHSLGSWACASVFVLLACNAEIGVPSASEPGGAAGAHATGGSAAAGGSGSIPNAPPAFEPAPGALRRLTRAQFRNTVRDLLGVEVDVSQLQPDSWNGNFATIGAATVVTSQTGVERYHSAIEGAVDVVFGDVAKRDAFVGCVPSGAADPCIRDFVTRMGRRAWRRPLEASELERLVALVGSVASELDSSVEGLRWVTVALFTSPNFLYRPELGAPVSGGGLRFTSFEMASRLSFLLWNSAPDESLLDEAASGALTTSEGVGRAVERLLDAPAGREAIGEFAEQYLRLDRVLSQAKDAGLYPEYGPALQAAMVRDMRSAWESVTFDTNSSALDLFSTRRVVVNADLARLYGLDDEGLDAETFAERTLPEDGPRLGILGKAAVLSQFANQKEGSPTLRGKFIREALMCLPVPPPPGDVNAMLEEPPAGTPMTKRQRLEQHRSSPTCAGCHGLMDPLGLPLEQFDAIGRYRTTDHGLSIDPSGDFDGQPVANARELGSAMSSSEVIADCLARRFYSYAVGHEERAVDATVIESLKESFRESGHRLRELFVRVVTDDAFSSVAPQP